MDAPTLASPRLHPLNVDFRWQDAPRERARRLSAAQVDQFNRDGFFLYEDAFTADEIAAVAAAIDPLEKAHEEFTKEQGGKHRLSSVGAISFTAHIVGKSPVLQAFAAHPVIKDICRDLIGPDVRLYWDQSVYKKTEKLQEFPWHQDNGYTFIEPQQYLTLWIPLVDVDEENGCPWIAPGLHKLGTLEHWPTEIGRVCLESAPDAVPVPAKAGDIVVFSSLAPHRTGPNLKAGTVRKAYILQYAPDGAITRLPDGQVIPQTDPARQFKILENGR
ncbi:phytanoyl-CoA dioxygenase family protein [Phenylobacterium terrae]|uniref:Phytanoyl-CoA dioxygenase family protein n=1 Tax=Phenylobacterium terrae TaxID=2665495 RepID=A0ABW4N625_9CAUL